MKKPLFLHTHTPPLLSKADHNFTVSAEVSNTGKKEGHVRILLGATCPGLGSRTDNISVSRQAAEG